MSCTRVLLQRRLWETVFLCNMFLILRVGRTLHVTRVPLKLDPVSRYTSDMHHRITASAYVQRDAKEKH